MGTSNAYGGSAGWSDVEQQTQEWLDSGAGTEDSQPGGDDATPAAAADATDEPGSSEERPPITPLLRQLIGEIGRRFTGSHGSFDGPGGGGGRGAGATSGDGRGRTGTGRSTARAAAIGGRAAASAYGLRAGIPGLLVETGLSLDDLRGRSRNVQARLLLEAAMGPSGGIQESELRVANADLILWALSEEVEPTPLELANRWVVEYVWQVWMTEAGPTIRIHSANGYDSLRVEQEMRAALEATVVASGLPDDRPLATQDFEQAIESALSSLGRIAGATE